MRIFVGQPHIGHVHARLEILWILHPLRQILGIVCQHSRSQCFSLSDVRQIWSYLGDSLGITGDAVALHARGRVEKFFTVKSGWVR